MQRLNDDKAPAKMVKEAIRAFNAAAGIASEGEAAARAKKGRIAGSQ